MTLVKEFNNITEAHSEPSKTFNMEAFLKIINGWKLLTISVKTSPLDVWQGSEYTSALRIEGLLKYGQI